MEDDVRRLPRPRVAAGVHRRRLPAYVDGKARFDGVRSFLASRGIALPDGATATRPATPRSSRSGNRKNQLFDEVLPRRRHAARTPDRSRCSTGCSSGVASAVVSSSRNAPTCSGIRPGAPVHVVIDGAVAAERGIPGKPAPDLYLAAAERWAWRRPDAVVVEDASPASPPGGPVTSGWSSASTVAPARRRCWRTAPISSSTTSATRRGATLVRTTRPPSTSSCTAIPSIRGASSSGSSTDRDLGLTETLVRRGQRVHGHAGQPRGGSRGPQPRHVPQRLPRDVAHPPCRGGVRLRQDRARRSSTSPMPS